MLASECTICAEPLDGGEEQDCVVTRCGHVFHAFCLEKWFEHKPVCPLCKEAPPRSERERIRFVRGLRAPAPLEPAEEARMRVLAAASETAADAAARLDRAIDRDMRDLDELNAEAEAETRRAASRRSMIHRLETELLKVQRELAAAQRIEAAAEAAAGGGSSAASGGMAAAAAAVEVCASEGRQVDEAAVLKQRKQIIWRCQELRQLDEKIGEVKARTASRGRKAVST